MYRKAAEESSYCGIVNVLFNYQSSHGSWQVEGGGGGAISGRHHQLLDLN